MVQKTILLVVTLLMHLIAVSTSEITAAPSGSDHYPLIGQLHFEE